MVAEVVNYTSRLQAYSLPRADSVSLLAVFFILFWVFGSGARSECSKIETFHAPRTVTLPRAEIRSPSDEEMSLLALMKLKVPSIFGRDASYRSAPWLFNGHLQTIYAAVRAPHLTEPIEYDRILIRVADGGILALDVTPPLSSRPFQTGEPVLFVAHGVNGGSRDSYIRATLADLCTDTVRGGLNMRAVVMNSRGCNHSPVTTPKLYHAGATDDIRHAMLWISKAFPGSPVYGLGFSLGANLLTKYVGEEGDACPLSAVVSVANPFDFIAVSKNVELFSKRLYNLAMGHAARSLLARHRKIFEDGRTSPISKGDLDTFLRKRFVILRDYDTAITTPVFGFAHPHEYYATASSARFTSRVRIPFLGLNAADDPILGPDVLPFCDAYTNPWILLVRTRHGGHLAWFETGPHGALRRWFVKPVREFFAALMEHGLDHRPRIEFVDEQGKISQKGRLDVSFTVVLAKDVQSTTGDSF